MTEQFLPHSLMFLPLGEEAFTHHPPSTASFSVANVKESVRWLCLSQTLLTAGGLITSVHSTDIINYIQIVIIMLNCYLITD